MQKSAQKTIEPRAYDPLIHEGFIRQADLVKAVQESLQGFDRPGRPPDREVPHPESGTRQDIERVLRLSLYSVRQTDPG